VRGIAPTTALIHTHIIVKPPRGCQLGCVAPLPSTSHYTACWISHAPLPRPCGGRLVSMMDMGISRSLTASRMMMGSNDPGLWRLLTRVAAR
jgi:hypothetical protein